MTSWFGKRKVVWVEDDTSKMLQKIKVENNMRNVDEVIKKLMEKKDEKKNFWGKI
jgi:predicted CopG family antitoxin